LAQSYLDRGAELGSQVTLRVMNTHTRTFGWRRGFSLLLGFVAAYMFFGCVMMFIEEFPKRSLDTQAEHWWHHFIMAFGVVFIVGCITLWAAVRLWRTPSSHA